MAHVSGVSWHEFTSGGVRESEAVIVQKIAVEKGSEARVESDRVNMIRCESEANGEGGLLGEVEDRQGGSYSGCYRGGWLRVQGHGEDYALSGLPTYFN